MVRFLLCFFLLLAVTPAVAAEEKSALFSYETVAGIPVGAVFGALPTLATKDELIGVTSSVCDHVEIHRMIEEDGIMKMRKVDGLRMDAGQSVVLSAEGYHLMLMKLKSPLQDGQRFLMTLDMRHGKDVTLPVVVKSRKVKSSS